MSDPRGFSTRAICAASRAPALDQTPTTVPIYQTATFAAADADELGEVLADPRGGYAYVNPTTSLADHEGLAALAHRHGSRYVVDNTFASPYVCRPALAAIPDEVLPARASVPALGAI